MSNNLGHRVNHVREGLSGFRSVGWVPTARRWAWILSAVCTIGMVARFPFLPQTVPTHFDLTGQPDGYGSRWVLPILCGVMLLAIWLVAVLSRRTDLHNNSRHVPAERAEKFHQNAERAMVRLMLFLVLIYALMVLGYYGLATTALVLPTVAVMTVWALVDGLRS